MKKIRLFFRMLFVYRGGEPLLLNLLGVVASIAGFRLASYIAGDSSLTMGISILLPLFFSINFDGVIKQESNLWPSQRMFKIDTFHNFNYYLIITSTLLSIIYVYYIFLIFHIENKVFYDFFIAFIMFSLLIYQSIIIDLFISLKDKPYRSPFEIQSPWILKILLSFLEIFLFIPGILWFGGRIVQSFGQSDDRLFIAIPSVPSSVWFMIQCLIFSFLIPVFYRLNKRKFQKNVESLQ